MPTYAVGSKSGLAYVAETVYGAPPASPAMKGLRAKFGSKFELKRDTFSSKEVSSTRQVMGMTYGNRSGSGSLPVELSYGSFDDFIEAVMGGTWTTNVLKVGNVGRSFTIEDQTSEVGVYEQNLGVVMSGLSLGIKPNAIVEGSFDFIFKDQKSMQLVSGGNVSGTFSLGAVTLAMTANSTGTATATRSAGSFITDGLAVGDYITFTGVLAPTTNTGPFVVTIVTATVVTFATNSTVVQAATPNCGYMKAPGINVAATGKTWTRSSGSWITDGYVVGDSIYSSGVQAAGNIGVFTITAVTATVITCSAAAGLVDQNCATFPTVVTPALGIGPLASSLGGTNTAANTNTPFDAFTGSILEGGQPIGYVTGLDLKLSVAAQGNNIVFSPVIQNVTLGQLTATGNMTVYFLDQRLKQKFLGGTTTSLQFTLGSGGSGSYLFNMGTVKYTSHTRDDQENAIIENVGFSALYDTTDASTLKITRVP